MSKQYYDENGNPIEVEVVEKKKKRGGCLKWALMIIGVLVLFGACSAIFSDSEDNTTDTETTEVEQSNEVETDTEETVADESEGAELLTVGESHTIGDYTLTVNDAYYTDERNQFDETNPEKVIAIEYTLENNSDQDYPFGIDTQVYVDGKQADSYALGSDMGSVSSGRTVDGTTYYGVNGEKVELEWEPTFSFSGDKGIWDITPAE